MAIMRVHKTANYTIMSNHHFKEKEMSLKAKGLLSLMLSLPDDWDYSINGLATLSKDGKDSVMGALKELERFGYLIRTRLTNEKGQFQGYDYDIFEEPQKRPSSSNSNAEKPYSENPNSGNPPQLNTNSLTPKGINSVKDKDINDKEDKRLLADSYSFEAEEKKLSTIDCGKPNAFTKELIKFGYIENDDLQTNDYNQLFIDFVGRYGFDVARSCLWYFQGVWKRNNGKDENGYDIENRLAYLKTSLEFGAKKITTTYDPSELPEGLSWLAN